MDYILPYGGQTFDGAVRETDPARMKGRIDRDDWVKQAKALAKGGEAEYVKVFGKKPR